MIRMRNGAAGVMVAVLEIAAVISCGCTEERTQSAAESPADHPPSPTVDAPPAPTGSSTRSDAAGTTKGVGDALNTLNPGPVIVPAPIGR